MGLEDVNDNPLSRDSKRSTDVKNRLWALGEERVRMIWENGIETLCHYIVKIDISLG